MKKLHVLLFVILGSSFFTLCGAQTGTWTAVTNVAPDYCNGGMSLLTDGRVICHTTAGGGNGTGWDVLTPDSTGSYINGTWSTITPMTYERLFFSSQVLPSGKVYVAGGEYGAGGTEGEVYDPVTNSWTTCLGVPTGWNIYDGNSELLYNGNVLEGPQVGANPSYDCLLWSPVTNTYTIAPSAIYDHDEAQWLKLPDSSVLFIGIATDYSNRYIPQLGTWILDDTVPGNIFDPYGEEAGCAFMLPNKKAIFFGATPFNAFYTPTGNTTPGKWTAADSFPMINGTYLGMPDASGDMMVNGHILVAASPIGTSSNEFNYPCYFLEYDYTTNTFTQVKSPIPISGGDSLIAASYQTNMINLPDGNVLVSNYQQGFSNQYLVYTPGSGPIAQGKPTINSIIGDSCPNYRITGKMFNGFCEGSAYGDDWQMETNYPLVRLTNGTHVYYAKTSNWNRIGAVATDSLEDTATFQLPPNLPTGTYSLVVVVNGFASNPVLFSPFSVSVGSVANTNFCYGDSSGSITATVQGGTSPFTYVWSPNGGTNRTASGLSAGTYTVLATDHNGCTQMAIATLTQPSAPVSGVVSGSNVSCNSLKDGLAYVIASGGITPYTYLWSNGKTTTNNSGLSAGIYTVTVTDNNNCTTTITDTVKQPKPMTVLRDSVGTQTGGCRGLAAVTVSGGAVPYTYSWSPGGETTDTIKQQCSGTYCCTITDNNGCQQVTCITIKEITGIDNIRSGNGQITIYPNPNNGEFVIQSSAANGRSSLEIYNVLGQNIYSNSLNLSKGSSAEINLGSQSAGVYFYRISKQDGSLIGEGKIVVEK